MPYKLVTFISYLLYVTVTPDYPGHEIWKVFAWGISDFEQINIALHIIDITII